MSAPSRSSRDYRKPNYNELLSSYSAQVSRGPTACSLATSVFLLAEKLSPRLSLGERASPPFFVPTQPHLPSREPVYSIGFVQVNGRVFSSFNSLSCEISNCKPFTV